MAKRANIEDQARKDAEETRIQGLKRKEYTSSMVQTNFRVSPEVKEELSKHFKSKGLSFGSGVRMVLMDYMKMNGVEL